MILFIRVKGKFLQGPFVLRISLKINFCRTIHIFKFVLHTVLSIELAMVACVFIGKGTFRRLRLGLGN